jgi:general secretion pathway protein G
MAANARTPNRCRGWNVFKGAGFTLIELLIVIAIISILSAIILGAMGAVRKNTKITLTQARISTLLKSALDTYEHDFDDYPPSDGDDGIKGAFNLYHCLTTEKKNGPYIKLTDLPNGDYNGDTVFFDEWKKPIYYIHHRDYRNQPPNKHEYRLISGGPDGVYQGGDPASDDIVNWNKDKPEAQ